MGRFLRFAGTALALLLLLAGVWIWKVAFLTPSPNLLPLPAGLIAAESPQGVALLAAQHRAPDYTDLTRHFAPQARAAYCGVASAVMVLNALRGPANRLNQATFFTGATNTIRTSLAVTFGGMSLEQLGRLLRSHGAEVVTFYASDTGLEPFRTIAAQNLATPGDFLLVNYQRSALGQAEMGHISPVGAYDAASDRLLVLDVAAHKYPPVWVSTELLWRAMNTVDSASGRTRGFVIVRAQRPGQ